MAPWTGALDTFGGGLGFASSDGTDLLVAHPEAVLLDGVSLTGEHERKYRDTRRRLVPIVVVGCADVTTGLTAPPDNIFVDKDGDRPCRGRIVPPPADPSVGRVGREVPSLLIPVRTARGLPNAIVDRPAEAKRQKHYDEDADDEETGHHDEYPEFSSLRS